MNYKLSVIKIGGKDIFENTAVYSDIAALVSRGEKVVVVAGGSCAIEQQFLHEKKEMLFLTLANGDKVRYCNSDQMEIIERAYRHRVFSKIYSCLAKHQLSVLCLLGSDGGLVQGRQYPPLKVRLDQEVGRFKLIHDLCAGQITQLNKKAINQLLDGFDVLVFSPPIMGMKEKLLNVDADMLASHLCIALNASYLHFLTSTPGILKDINDELSTVEDLYLGEKREGLSFIHGRMKQKLRAAFLAVENSRAYVTISSSRTPHPLIGMNHQQVTHIWKLKPNNSREELLIKMVQIFSVSKYEHRLAEYITYRLNKRGIPTMLDGAGNVVSILGNGKRKLLLFGHIDTVPGNVEFKLDSRMLWGRGSVDAKGSYATFIEACEKFKDSNDIQIILIGGIEEEIHTAKGGIFVRDNYSADAVVIGEPSHYSGITLGYHGMFKVQISVTNQQVHSAAKDYLSSADQLISILQKMREVFSAVGVENISLRELQSGYGGDCEFGQAAINFRINHECDVNQLEQVLERMRLEFPAADFELLRKAPGALFQRNSNLAKAFYRALADDEAKPRFVTKTGTSYMNTLKATWGCPMVAYGPGDSALDHTNQEHVDLDEVKRTIRVLEVAIQHWADYEKLN